ncbi:ETEC_3214 domain-containing protein [Streptomyces sp. NPDC056817]|uniref:ETEC_3214 domain-containing protein n=1 Tax=Streptomyces sp. NPDC056817 TaxID=3345950 RepID=UPI003679C3E4
MTPDPEPWYSTTLNVWTLAGTLVATWTLIKLATEGWRRTVGRRHYLTLRLRKIAPGVLHDYVVSLLGEPTWQSTMECTRLTFPDDDEPSPKVKEWKRKKKEVKEDDNKAEVTVRTWPLSRLGYLVTWSEDDIVVMYGITTASWWFRPRVVVGNTRIRLGKTTFAALSDPEEHRAWLGNRRFGYMESHYFGNPGGYRSWYVGVNDFGYNAAPPPFDAFDDKEDSRTRLLSSDRGAYRARAPINTVVISGIALYREVQDGSIFGTSLGVNQDLVRLTEPEYHVLDGLVSRAHARLRQWHWDWRHSRWERKQNRQQPPGHR